MANTFNGGCSGVSGFADATHDNADASNRELKPHGYQRFTAMRCGMVLSTALEARSRAARGQRPGDLNLCPNGCHPP